MERIWAPWRMSYISGIDKKDEGCVFCTKPAEKADRENLILHRGESCFVVMNLYPYTNGHLLVVPYTHVSDLCLLDTKTSSELWELICHCRKALAQAFRPDGFNIGINQGRAAGAGIETHLHAHVVPRWSGDVNFMAVLSDIKVISQGLAQSYEALSPYFRSIAGNSSTDSPSA